MNLGLIASGSGTNAEAIMKSWRAGCIPEINQILLISTERGAGCLEKAIENKIIPVTIDYNDCKSIGNEIFNAIIKETLVKNNVSLVFLVGCIRKIYPIEGIDIYNIHPANLPRYGGKGMYGLKPHIAVLKSIMTEHIIHGKKITNRFFTYPTIHEVIYEYDAGKIFLQVTVEIPRDIIEDLFDRKEVEVLAKRLQEHVLAYEHILLPAAVRMAAKKSTKKEVNRNVKM